MNLKKSILSLLVLVLWTFAGEAQCPDFTNLNSSSVTGYYGYINDSELNVGIVPERHTLITQQGTDPKTGGQLPLIPDGENTVIRLGNWAVGAQTESLVYTFIVDPDYPVLLLKYAVVLQDPHHEPILQPRFLIQMLDANGELLSGCMEYNVVSSSSIPGFQLYDDVMWRPWTTNGFDLSLYAGQTVKFKISTFDCVATAHFGYAYFTASCISDKLSITGCNGQQVTITAPSGFESYTWNNGSHASSTTYTIQGNTVATCVINTVTGCQITQSVTFTQDTIPQDYVFHDTICEGMDYHNHGFNLPVYTTPGDYVAYNTYYNASDCIEEGTNMLYLHVHPRYHHIYDVACEGQSYNAYGFQYSQLVQGEITDTSYVPLPYGCDSTTILHLTVNHTFSMSDVINGPTEVCSGAMETYTLANMASQTSNNYHWTVPDGVVVYIGQGTSSAQLFFTQNAPSPAHITFSGSNGCGSSTIPLDIAVSQSYYNMYNDTVCTGNAYTQHGYQLGIQDSVGYYVHILNNTTQHGCDSVIVLQLLVAETPSIVALADPTEICLGRETDLFAVGAQATVTLPSQLHFITIGDILCTDSTFVHPQDWPCGKVAWGIVFYVDTTGQHGWAVSLNNEIGAYRWATINMDLPSVPNYSSCFTVLEDRDGYQNSANIRIFGDANQYPAAYVMDFNQGWYLPAAAQLYHLYAVLGIVNNSLQLIGVNPFPMDHVWRYWSSTEASDSYAWFLDSNQTLMKGEKSALMFVRSVRNF
jgi:hypothetical protein